MKSQMIFFTYNSFLIMLSIFQYYFMQYLPSLTYVILLFRNLFLIYTIDQSTKHKDRICDTMPKESFRGEFMGHILSSTFIEYVTFMISYNLMMPYNLIITDINFWYDLLYFIPISFIFEVIFDFFHYWSHRLIHHYPILYKNLHKKHHKFKHPTAITTYYQSPLDLILSNLIPHMLTLSLIKPLSLFQYIMLLTYKTNIEISGHLGKRLNPTSSFTQFIWLPRWLKIESYTETHDLHHSMNNCNYSKRFVLWDKLFGTFRDF